jgi:hypothetical protein
MQPWVEQESTPGLKLGQVLSLGVGFGIGSGTAPVVISMSAQLVHT